MAQPVLTVESPASPASPENDPFTDRIECSAITIADVLRTDIMQLSCLQCEGATEQDSPCYATIHPFCDLFHRWLSDRLGGDFDAAQVDGSEGEDEGAGEGEGSMGSTG